MDGIIKLIKAFEDTNVIKYCFRTKNLIFGDVIIKKNIDIDKELPEITNKENLSATEYRKIVTRISYFIVQNKYPKEDKIYPSY